MIMRFTWSHENNPNEDEWFRERFPSADHEPKLSAECYGEYLFLTCVCGQWEHEIGGTEHLTTLLELYTQHVGEATK